MTDAIASDPQESRQEPLVSRLAVVEGLDLDERAPGYVAIYDELRERLEGGDESRT